MASERGGGNRAGSRRQKLRGVPNRGDVRNGVETVPIKATPLVSTPLHTVHHHSIHSRSSPLPPHRRRDHRRPPPTSPYPILPPLPHASRHSRSRSRPITHASSTSLPCVWQEERCVEASRLLTPTSRPVHSSDQPCLGNSCQQPHLSSVLVEAPGQHSCSSSRLSSTLLTPRRTRLRSIL